MPNRWMQAYEAAIREQDPAKLPDLCDAARKIINDRIMEHRVTGTERETLDEALRHLVIYELKPTPRKE